MDNLSADHLLDEAFILHALPENYRLFEHIKTNPEKNTKNHAGGGHDRQDAYLYGHPGGRRRRYRSPADFFPHLLWLVASESGDEKDCGCKICAPDEIQPDEDKAKPKRKKVDIVEKPSPAPAPAQSVGQPVIATPPPQPRSIDQQLDLQYEQFLCRQGELVWFLRTEKTGAWALGVIVRRWYAAGRKPQYLIQPLSWPGERLSLVDIESEKTQLRPWLVWSPPRFTHLGLNDLPDLRFENADWNDISRGVFGMSTEIARNIDGSILAAKDIDCTYTPFELLSSSQDGNYSVKRYNGFFLGGEKLWVGDVACINGDSTEDVLVIIDIVERMPIQAFSNPLPTVTLVGDVYKLIQRPGPEIKNLPSRMRDDVKLRNAIIQKQDPRAMPMYWHLIRTNQTMDVDSLKCRWYESTILIPVINPRDTKLPVQDRVMSVSRKVNPRLQCVGMNKSMSRYAADRVQVFGNAVPPGLVIINGIDAPHQTPAPQQQQLRAQEQPVQQQPPQPLPYDINLNIEQLGPAGENINMQFQHQDFFGTSAQYPQEYLTNTTTAGEYQQPNFFSEQMDLDSMPGYGQEYGSHDQFFQPE